MYLPLTLVIYFSLPVWASVSLVPPSTFPTISSSSSTSSSTVSRSLSGSRSTSLPASTTSTAQFPSLSGFSSCVTNCLATAIGRVNCSSVVDVNCFCVAPNFPDELTACVENDGCGTDLSTAENLAQSFCNVASASPSLSFQSIPTATPSPTPSSSSSSSASSSTSTAPSSSTPTSSSSSSARNVGTGTLLGLGVGLFGMLLGTCAVW